MQASTSTGASAARARLEDLAGRMDPGANRSSALRQLDALFRSGTAPDPLPEGFLPGRLIGTSILSPLDALVARIAAAWMPWQGKTFDREAQAGVNRFDASARTPLRVLFPGYRPERDLGNLIEAFPMRNRVAPGEVDPDVQVFKIDYDFDANPRFIIRHIMDELVQIDDGLYLGKILYRTATRFHPIGFFSLERVAV